MDSERLAITHNGVDVLRIIPRGFDGDRLDIKVAVPHREFDVYYYPLMKINPGYMPGNGPQGDTVTYHRNTKDKPAVIHVKGEVPDAYDGKRYHDVPLCHVMAPSVGGLLPLPIMKIELPNNLAPAAKARKRRSGKKQYEIGADCNAVEVFLARTDWEERSPFSMWDFVSRAIALPFETWSSSSLMVNSSKATMFDTTDRTIKFGSVSFGDFSFLILEYPQLLMPEAKRVRLTFIDNELAEAIMVYSEVIQAQGKGFTLTCAPRLDTLRWPSPMRLNRLKFNDMWVQVLRSNPGDFRSLGCYEERIEDDRTRLLGALLDRNRQQCIDKSTLESALEKLEEAMPDFHEAEFKTVQQGLWLAPRMSKTGYFIFHTTEIWDPEGNPVDVYCFFTLDDYDVHYDLSRLAGYSGKRYESRVLISEGRPFSEGLAGMRAALYESGYKCGPTYSRLMVPKLREPPYGEICVGESYAVISTTELYHQLDIDERTALRHSLGLDDKP